MAPPVRSWRSTDCFTSRRPRVQVPARPTIKINNLRLRTKRVEYHESEFGWVVGWREPTVFRLPGDATRSSTMAPPVRSWRSTYCFTSRRPRVQVPARPTIKINNLRLRTKRVEYHESEFGWVVVN